MKSIFNIKFNFYFFLIIFISSLLTLGFQCSTPEMSTAKLAMKNKEWEKARNNLEKEINKNPQNAEARIMLAEVKERMDDYLGAANTIVEADEYIKDEKLRQQSLQFKYVLWIGSYNLAVELFNNYFTKKQEKLIDSAIYLLKVCTQLRPQMSHFYNLLGRVFETKGDTARAITAFEKYSELMIPVLNLAKEKNIYLDAPRNDVMTALGKPAETRGSRSNPAADSTLYDRFVLNGKDVFVYYQQNADGIFTTYGWKVDPPTDWHPDERKQPIWLSTEPYSSLAQIYFEKKDYEKAIKNILNIVTLEPTNSSANSFLVYIYDVMGQGDQALKFSAELVKKNPKNKVFRAQYGDLLLQLNRYDEAIAQYQEVMNIDPNIPEVMRNLGAAYKNKVVAIQKKQQEEIEKDPSKSFKPDEYMPYLKKSAEYFEMAKNTVKYGRDVEILGELAEIYYVAKDKDRFKIAVAELESMEALVPTEKKAEYYLKLIKIFDSWDKNPEKLSNYQKKLNELGK